MIEELQKYQKEYGDLEVRFQWADPYGPLNGDGYLISDSFSIDDTFRYKEVLLIEGYPDY